MTKDRTPSLAGSSGKDSPNLTGWGNAAISGFQGKGVKDELREWISARYPSKESESPIEQLFNASMLLLWDQLMLPRDGVNMAQQASVGNYRADFLFTVKAKDGTTKRLVVEMDGHDFHERTKEQAARDKARDRWMTANAYEVMRFSGSEIWRNPFKAASECSDRIHQLKFGETAKQARWNAFFDGVREFLDKEGGA